MYNDVTIFIFLIHIKDDIIIISLFYILNEYYRIFYNNLLLVTTLVLLQYMMYPIRYKINYLNNIMRRIHKLFSYEVVYVNYFGEQHLLLFAHEYYLFKTLDIIFYQKESYFHELLVYFNDYMQIIKDYNNKPDYDCPICLGDGEKWMELPCKHKIHYDCIKTWFITSNNKSCPLCMQDCSDEFISLLI